MIVADTNLIVHLVLRSQDHETARKVYLRDSHWTAPELWVSEFRNVLALYMRKNLLQLDEAIAYMRTAETVMNDKLRVVSNSDVLRLAATSGCSAYDCEFVALALEEDVPLVTADKGVLRAFPDVALTATEFLQR